MHSYAGYENKVKTNLESRISSLDMEDYIFQVEVPTEEVVEIKNGKRQQVNRKVFPGYILVRMDLTDDSWGAVRNTPGVTGFVGATSKPSPLSMDEVIKILAPTVQKSGAAGKSGSAGAADGSGSAPAEVVDFEIGESVTVMDGPVRHPAGHHQRDRRRCTPSSRCWSRSSAARLRSSCPSARSPRSKRHRPTRTSRPSRRRDDDMPPKKKKLTAVIKLQIKAGLANPAPPVGPALGQHGVNIMEFCKAYNAATEAQRGQVVPVEISVYEDRSFTFVTKTPPAARLLLQAAGVEKGSGEPHKTKVAKVSMAQVREIAQTKMEDLNANDLDQAVEDHRRHRPVDGNHRLGLAVAPWRPARLHRAATALPRHQVGGRRPPASVRPRECKE